MRLQITVATVTRISVAVVLALVIVSLAGQLAVRAFDWHPERDIVSFTNIDRERNVPTTFQALLMVGCTVALAGITVMRRLVRDRWTHHWGFLALIFLLLAWDETIKAHERFIEPLRRVFDLEGILFIGWVIPAGIAVALCAFAYLRFMLALPSPTRRLFIIAGITFVTGALVFESIGGAYYESIDQNADMTYVLMATVEETLDMAVPASRYQPSPRPYPGAEWSDCSGPAHDDRWECSPSTLLISRFRSLTCVWCWWCNLCLRASVAHVSNPYSPSG